jgi:hypothetical protein
VTPPPTPTSTPGPASSDTPADGAAGASPPEADRPPLVAMVVVGLVGVVILALFLRSGGLGSQSLAGSLLDEDESTVGPGTVTLPLGPARVTTDLAGEWIVRERCAGWTQLTSADGDATRVHLIATEGVPDPATGRITEVADYLDWLASEVGILQSTPSDTRLLDTPARAGRLTAAEGAPREALVAACAEDDGAVATGIRGPAAGFDQELVATRGRVDALGHVLVLGSAWVGGDIEVAAPAARRIASTLALVEE